jgi:thiol-disulfide isomerase/thioredoxin
MFKYSMFVLAVVTLIGCDTQNLSKDYTISGRVEGDLSKFKGITLTSFDGLEQKIAIDADGSFSHPLSDKGAIYLFNSGSGSKMIYAHDSGKLEVVVQQNEKSRWEPYFSGDGVKDIDFIEKVNRALATFYEQDEDMFKNSRLSEEEYVIKADQLRNQMLEFIEKADKEVLEDVKTAMIADINASHLFMYDVYKSLRKMNRLDFDKNGKVEIALQENDPDNIRIKDFMVSPVYRQLINGHWRDKARRIARAENINRRVAFNKLVQEEIEHEKIRNAMVFNNTKRYLGRIDDVDVRTDLKNSFLEASNNPLQVDFIEKMFVKLTEISKGNPSPTFVNYESYDGNTVSLADLKGHNVYIDFWATWCAPCKKEFPHLKKLEEKYHDSNITFVGVSLDKESKKEAWRAMVEEEELLGIQLFADNSFDSAFADAYQVSAIPRFVLIDKEGKIVNANAPRPSDTEEIDQLFETLEL